MADTEYSQEEITAFDEAGRAYERFKNVLDVHGAAIITFETYPTLPTVDDAVSTGLRMRSGMKPENPNSPTIERALRLRKIVEAERDRGYEVIRSSALVAACGAFEYLLKATYVSQALLRPTEAADMLSDARVKFSASEVMGKADAERWYVIADSLFKESSQTGRLMYSRVKHFLVEYVHMPNSDAEVELQSTFTDIDRQRFDKAFLLRNCIVHNGMRVGMELARHTGAGLGQEISFQKETLQPLLAPIRSVASWMNSLRTGFL